MSILIVFVRFDKGYHVGWRGVERVVDHVTVLRALISIGHSLRDQDLVDALMRCDVAASAMLPALTVDGAMMRLLTPFPAMPFIKKPSKIGVYWTTLYAAKMLVDFVQKCSSTQTAPVLDVDVERRRIVVSCEGLGEVLELKKRGSIACIDGGDCDSLPKSVPRIFEEIAELHSRIDRMTTAADLFYIRGYKPCTPLWIAFRCPSEGTAKHVLEALRILGIMGLGGYRSRGWGRFEVLSDAKPADIDANVLESHGWWKEGYNLLLGSALNSEAFDPNLSYVYTRIIMGHSGPSYMEYKLPFIKVLDVGSLVYTKQIPPCREFGMYVKIVGRVPAREEREFEVDYGSRPFHPYIVFNPFVVTHS